MSEQSTSDARPATHLCIAGSACRNPTITPDKDRIGAVTPDPDTICDACHRHITSSAGQLVKDWNNLRAALGERATASGEVVKSSPTPSTPVSASKDALMSDIVDIADRAAAIVSDVLNADQPDGRRRPPPPIRHAGHTVTVQEGSAAQVAEERSRPDDLRRLTVAVALVEPHIDKLATAPISDHVVWERDPTTGDMRRTLTEMTGLDIALDIVDVHNRTRAELGKTRLRHKFAMPCPRCAGRIGRDDGTAIVDCENCKASWTEREYKFLAGLVVDEGKEMDILKWLLAEAYWRLDTLKIGADLIREDPLLASPASGEFVLQGIDIVLEGHETSEGRKVTSDKAAAEERQTDEDTWLWKNETPYRPPRRKSKPASTYDGPRIATSSLSTITDDPTYLPEAADRRAKVCRNCNMIHAGDCIA